MAKERLLILDSNSLLNRAFYALPEMTNSEGIHTNAIYGFTTMLLKMKEEFEPKFIVATFDRKAPTLRHIEYKDYKAGRKKMPQELAEQFPIVKELLHHLAINIFEIDGFEADDLIGTLSVFAEKNGIEVYIVTGDKDALQLATENVKVVITKKGITEKEIYDYKRMVEEFGVTPDQFIDVKGLMGDASDNIPGVPGIGEKTAFKLIKEYGSMENVLQNIDNISGKKLKENLYEYSEQAIFSKKLSTIIKDVPVEIDLDSIKSKEEYDLSQVRKMLIKLQIRSLIDRFPDDKIDGEVKPSLIEVTAKEIETLDKLKILCTELKKNKLEKDQIIYINFEMIDPEVFCKSKIVNIYMSYKDENYVLNISKLLGEDIINVKEELKLILEDESIEKVCHNVKVPHTILSKMGIDLNGIKFDIMMAAYLIDSSRGKYNLKTLIEENLGLEVPEDGDSKLVFETSCMKEIYTILEQKIESYDMKELLYNVEQPLTDVLSSMEREGFKVDKVKLSEIGDKCEIEIKNVRDEIFELCGEEFNINSPKQLGKILFEKLDLPIIKKTKTGYSTNAEVLLELSDKHPVIDKITYYRQLAKLYSTYVEGLTAVIDEDSRIHSSFNQAVTTTGRLSSTEPNLQNIPIKYEMGKEIRKVFIPQDGDSVLLSADYSQIELRILAHIAGDENMIEAFKEKVDIHSKTASEVFKVPLDEVTHTMRSNAKAVNFGIVYGIGDYSLSRDLRIPRKEAKIYIETYFERYPNVKKYMSDIVLIAKEKKYVTTIMNRRRYIPEINSSNKMVMAFGERLAMNTPIQGSAADIIKMAMVDVYKALNEKGLKSTIILQVHDELILNVHLDELEEVKEIVKDKMENVVKLKVPLEVDMNVGSSWYDAK